jgi:hypothetical protein
MFLISWIDKKVTEIENDTMFKKYFKGIEIEEIEGTSFLINSESGIELVLSDVLIVHSIHLFPFNRENKEYNGEIPFSLKFSTPRHMIREVLGEPNKSGGGHFDLLGAVPKWDKYYFNDFSLHLQYSIDESKIDLITIASLKLEAYFNIGLQ